MKEVSKRKEWIKNVAIIFLIIMLILTFFSNTIMNYSLPEVAAQYSMSGSITNKVRGTGVVESQDPYVVMYNQSRKIASVNVYVGQTVEKGDVLYYLEDGESEELKNAEKTLVSLKEAYDRYLISGQISSSTAKDVENGKVQTTEEKQKAISNAKSKITKAEKNIASYEKTISTINENIAIWNSTDTHDITEKVALKEAKDTLATWRAQKNVTEAMVSSAQAKVDACANPVVGDSTYDAAMAELDYAVKCDNTATTQIAYYLNKVDTCQKAIDDAVAQQEAEKEKTEKKLTDARTSLETAQQNLSSLLEKYSTQFDLQDKLNEIEAQEKEVERLRAEQGALEIVAPVSGSVISLNYVAGETISAGSQISSIQIAGKGYTLSMTVPVQQAMLLSVGDEAEVTNSWWYSDIHARVSAIKPDPSNPSKSKIVVFEVMGDCSNGQSLSLVAGKRTASYDCIVPTNAIREDNNGKFVYRVTSKSTPLGVRYYAERVDVTVLAEDDTTSAIKGDLSGWEYIITTSTKPIEDGMQIRLKD